MISVPIVFDLDGTLIDSLQSVTKAANALLAQYGLAAIPETQVAGYVGLGEQVFIDKLIADTALDASRRSSIMDDFIAHYVVVSKKTVLFEGVIEMLTRFQERGIPMGLCTNKPMAALKPVLEATDMARFFNVVVAGDSYAVRKPDALPLNACFDELGGHGVYVGDSPVDAQTALNAKVPFALFSEGIRTVPVTEIPHDALFDDMSALDAIYDRLSKSL
ncbi:HAD-IA family hydrolase [Planktotalea sp.]|uniref:HAD-IA family hydrolase n=1 Tax=Planktotalea sp. TaxID=2029877 RepID=UPI003297AF03